MNEIKMVSKDTRMLQILDMAERISDVSVPVLVTGEPGTGKKRLIEYIVTKSTNYSSKPFVHIPTYLLAGDDFENELLGIGHIPAARSQPSYIEIANGGTMLFDNIESMPLKNQPFLLEMIQQDHIRRPKSRDELKIDIRFFATAIEDLRELVVKGQFREDLYYRLNVVHISIPPLRERGSDIELLINYFLNDIAEQMHPRKQYSIQPDVVNALKQYPWPGNLTELHNEIWRASFISEGKITTEHISDHILNPKLSDYPKIQHEESKHSESYFIAKPHWRGSGFETKRNYCFVLMPFSEAWSQDVWEIIKDSISELGFICERADDKGGRVIMEDIWACINMANLLVVDLTARNPNVAYEVGMADVIGKEVIFLTQEADFIPFDFLGQRLIVYENTLAGAKKLKEELQRRIRLLFPIL